jgi:hypothetical protein
LENSVQDSREIFESQSFSESNRPVLLKKATVTSDDSSDESTVTGFTLGKMNSD